MLKLVSVSVPFIDSPSTMMSGEVGDRMPQYSFAMPCGCEIAISLSGIGSPAACANESSSRR